MSADLVAEEREWRENFETGQFHVACLNCGSTRHLPPEFYGLIESGKKLATALEAAHAWESVGRTGKCIHSKTVEDCAGCQLRAAHAREIESAKETINALADRDEELERLRRVLEDLDGEGVPYWIRTAAREALASGS